MLLPVPVVGTTFGPDWANDINACLSILDQHDHTSGSGVPITPSGLSITSDLSFQNSSATALKSAVFTAQSSLATLDALYVKGVDLYYNDGSGNVIQMTSGGSVNATSSGISSGTASASFVGGVLIVNAASTTPANIKGGSLLLGNNTAGSHYLTLAPPNAMGADYGLTLPAIPASNNTFLTIGTSGTIASTLTCDFVTMDIVANKLVVHDSGIDTTQLKNGAVTKAKQASIGQQISSSSGNYSTSSSTFSGVTNLSVTLTTTGRPVQLMVVPDGNTSLGSFIGYTYSGSNFATFAFFDGSTQLTNMTVDTSSTSTIFSSLGMDYFYVPSAGTYNYNVQVKATLGLGTVFMQYLKLVAYEL